MRFSHFFIDRPIFASVLSIIILIVGGIAQFGLPVSEYPEIAPPTVNVTATYPGASAEVIAQTVATPLELEINGVDDMLYINSQSTGDGRLSINVVFKPGTNIDQAQVNVQNRVAVAQPRLPEDVQRLGIVVRKASPDLMMVVHMTSPDDSRDQQYISNYATLYVKDVLGRIDGVGNVIVFGARDYSMRVWLDPAARRRPQPDGRRSHAGDARGQPAGRRRRHQPGAGRVAGRLHAVGADAGTPHEPRGVRQHRAARRDRRLGDAAARRGPHRAGRAGLHAERLSRQQERHRARHLPAARLERHRHVEPDQGDDGAAEEGLPGRPRLFGGLQSDGVHPGLGRRGDRDAVRGADAGRDRGDRVPADLAGRDHPPARHPGLADRLVRRDGRGRRLVQHAVAVRPGAGDRHRRRRRHRRGRERRALSHPGHVAQGGGAQDHGRGRRRADRHLPGADRGVPADRLHHRPAGHVLQAVRHHHRRLDGDLGLRVADAVARHGGAAAQDPCAVACREAQADADRADRLAAQLVLPPVQPWLRMAGEFLWPRHSAPDPRGDHRPGRLCRPAGSHRIHAGEDADRPGPAARPLLPDRRHAASGRRDARARRQAGEARRRR